MAIPNAPSDLVAVAVSSSQIDLSWTDNSLDETGFEVERSTNGTTGWVLVTTTAADATSYSDTHLPANTTRHYRVRATNADGDSAYTSVANATTLLPGRNPFEPRMYVHSPAVVFAAQVNAPGGVDYPVSFIAYNNVTTGDYTDISPGMTLLLGTTPGADNLGRQRIREVNGAGATTISVWVGRSSQGSHDGELTVTDDAYITVLDDRRVWAKIPFIDSSGAIFKDSNLEVEWRTTTPPPVANCGAGFAGTIDSTGKIYVLFNGQSSFAVADGATITDYLWDIGDGTLLPGSSLTDDFISASFPAGFRYVSLTVTDSEGHSHTAYCPVYARDPDNDTSFDEFVMESHRITAQGQNVSVRITADMPRATYPDGTFVMIWEREPTGTADRDHMLIQGWIDTEPTSMAAGRTGLLRDTTLTILDVAGRLDQLPGFPQTVADDATRDTALIPEITWSYMTTPNLDKYLHYLLHWHSTALDVADFVWSGTGSSYEFVLLGSDGESLWNQVDRRARAFVPDRVLTCDRSGRMAVKPDPMLQDAADRTATVAAAIDEDEWSDIRYTYQRHPRAHWLRASAVLAGSTEPIGTVFSIAPGDTPGQGVGELTQGEQLAISQTALNAATGHRYARANAPHGPLAITLLQDDGSTVTAVPWREIEPADMEWVTLTVSEETAAQRGLTFTAARGLVKELTIRYNQGRTGTTRTIEITWERETSGEPGKTIVKPDVPAVGDQPDPGLVTTPPDFGIIEGQQQVAAVDLDGYIYRTSDFQTPSGSGGPTWDRVSTGITETIYGWVVDPFSPGYIAGAGSIDGWIATETDIYRVEDVFGTPSVTSVLTFGTTASASSFHWRSIQASFGAYFAEGVNPWLLCISYYGSTSGHEGTWATYSVDGGATWAAEVQVSEFYDSGTPARFNPIGVYTSPKTPGLAYTAAYTETASPALADGYVSTDWGATWARVSAEPVDSVDEPLPWWGIFNDTDDLLTEVVVGGHITYGLELAQVNGDGPENTGVWNILLALPDNAVRVVVSASYIHAYEQDISGGGSTAAGVTYSLHNPTELSITEDLTFTAAAANAVTSQNYTVEWTKVSGTGWPGDRDDLDAEPVNNTLFARWRLQLTAVATGTADMVNSLSHTAEVTEIELSDGTIYTPPAQGSGMIQPGHALAGSIHLPWPANSDEQVAYFGYLDKTTNREFRLKRALGSVITDISPSDGSRSYGVNRYGFAVRTHDSNRQYALASVIGNDASADAGDDWHAVYVSSDFGDTWTEVIAPVADTEAPANRPAFEAAFGGDSEQVLLIWGPAAEIYYSSDMGATVDSRAGNLGTLGATGFVGIAGGS